LQYFAVVIENNYFRARIIDDINDFTPGGVADEQPRCAAQDSAPDGLDVVVVRVENGYFGEVAARSGGVEVIVAVNEDFVDAVKVVVKNPVGFVERRGEAENAVTVEHEG
jgi:hypothetical protein